MAEMIHEPAAIHFLSHDVILGFFNLCKNVCMRSPLGLVEGALSDVVRQLLEAIFIAHEGRTPLHLAPCLVKEL
jgi:hypothetical protein